MTDRRIEVVRKAAKKHTVVYFFSDGRWHCDSCPEVWPSTERTTALDHHAETVLAALDADWVAHLDEIVEAGAEGWWNAHGADPSWAHMEPDNGRDVLLADMTAGLSAAHRRWREG